MKVLGFIVRIMMQGFFIQQDKFFTYDFFEAFDMLRGKPLSPTESGHLVVDPSPEDGRVRIIRRTGKGQAAVRRLSGLLDGLEADWANRVGTRRYDEFRAILDELAGV